MDEAPPVLEDRRRDRTSETLQALARLLDAARRRSGLEALALTDRSGLLLSGSGPARLCDELAAWAPLAGRTPDNDTVPSSLDALERRTGRRRLALDGIEIIVSTLGDGSADGSADGNADGAGVDREIDAVSAGLRRILAAGDASV